MVAKLKSRVKGKSSPKKTTKGAFSLNQAIKHLELISNAALTSRVEFLKSLMDPEGRDLDEECGYISDPTVDDYMSFFRRHGIARKVVSVYPDETWAFPPAIYEKEKGTSPWEKELAQLMDDQNVIASLHRLDVNCGIGRFGILYMAYDDVKKVEDLAKPVRGLDNNGKPFANARPKNKLLFLRPFDETLVKIQRIESSPISPRQGLPKTYSIQFHNPDNTGIGDDDDSGENEDAQPVEVHWTRVLHVADNKLSNELYGMPRMEPVLNWLSDLRKVSGGSAEMFWKGAFPGYSVETHPDVVDTAELDDESVKEQFEAYMNGLQRYLAMVGVSVKSLAPQVADPTNHVDTLFRLISSTLNTPMRIFTGSEAAHLASSQDGITWNRRLMKRQQTFVNPYIIRPFIDRLMLVGVLPKIKKYHIDWMDLNALAAEDQADVALKRTQAVMQYVSGGGELVIPPAEYFTMILGFSQEQTDMVMKELAKAKKKVTKEFWNKPKPAGGAGSAFGKSKSKKSPTKKTNQNRNANGSKA